MSAAPGTPADPAALATPALVVEGVSKVYPGTRALDEVSLTVRHGEIHGLVGGNGSGKSTLIKILCGVVEADSGTITVGPDTLDAVDMRPGAAHAMGIRVVHQDLAVFPELSIAENMMLGSGYPRTKYNRVLWRQMNRQAQALIERFEIDARPSTLLRDLPVATRTQVAIARALQNVTVDQGVIILDEPTAALPVHEVHILLDAIRKLADQGHAVIFVSHRLDEVLSLTHRVTVLRDGKVFAEHRTSALSESELIESILGRRVADARSRRQAPVSDRRVISVQGLDAGPLRAIDLEVSSGEVVGVAGLLGSGRTELLQSLCGNLAIDAGTVTLDGKAVEFKHMSQAIDAGIVMIPEDRANGGAFPDMTVDQNIDVSVLRRYWRPTGFARGRMRRDSADLRRRFRVKAPSGAVAMSALSGGNQQKAILARWLRREPLLMLLDEPTQGVDVGARADIYAAVREVTDAGGAAIVVTSDLEELAAVVDRAVVLRQGRIVARVSGDALTAHNLNALIYRESQPA